MPQWEKGDEVWAARWGWPAGKIDVLSVRVASAGPKRAKLEKHHGGLNYHTVISHSEGSRTRRDALLVLRAEALAAVESARAALHRAENRVVAVDAALVAES